MRRAMLSRLESVTPEESRAAGIAVAGLLTATEAWRRARSVVLFLSRADEVDTRPLLDRARESAKEILLPRVVDLEFLEFAVLEDSLALREGRFGILEPPPEAPVERPDGHTVILVPGLAFDRSGGRLGRGWGYYDRSLAGYCMVEHRPLLIGVGFTFQVVDRVPMTDLDVRLDALVTEAEVVEADGWRGYRARDETRTGRAGRDD